MQLSTTQQLGGAVRRTARHLAAPRCRPSHLRKAPWTLRSLSDAEGANLDSLFGGGSETDDATGAAVTRAVREAVAQHAEEMQQLRAVVAELKGIADGTRLTADAVSRVEGHLVSWGFGGAGGA